MKRFVAFLLALALAVHVAWGANADDWEANNAKQQGVQETFPNLGIEIARNVAMVDATGAVWLLTATSDADTAPMSEVFDLPAAPTTAGEFKAWLDAVYGPGGIVTLGSGTSTTRVASGAPPRRKGMESQSNRAHNPR